MEALPSPVSQPFYSSQLSFSQRSFSQPVAASQASSTLSTVVGTPRFAGSVRPSLLLARTQLEQKQRDKQQRKAFRAELLAAVQQSAAELTRKIARRMEQAARLQTAVRELSDAVVEGFDEQSALLVAFVDRGLSRTRSRPGTPAEPPNPTAGGESLSRTASQQK